MPPKTKKRIPKAPAPIVDDKGNPNIRATAARGQLTEQKKNEGLSALGAARLPNNNEPAQSQKDQAQAETDALTGSKYNDKTKTYGAPSVDGIPMSNGPQDGLVNTRKKLSGVK